MPDPGQARALGNPMTEAERCVSAGLTDAQILERSQKAATSLGGKGVPTISSIRIVGATLRIFLFSRLLR